MHRSIRRFLPVLCAFTLMAPAVASAQEREISSAEATATLRAAQSVFTENFVAGGSPDRDATAALRDLAVALPELRGSQRRQGRALLVRPTKPGKAGFGPEADASPICNANFCVHWTDKQRNAPDSPEFIDEVVAALDRSYAVENGALGWQRAKSDGSRGKRGGSGGEGQVDVYITNLPRHLYGYAATDPGQNGSKRFAYLVLDNDYAGFPSPPLDSLQVTAAHEYNHVLQFGYDSLQDRWLFEATATWMEEQVYPDNNDYLNYLPAFAGGSRMPMTGQEIKIYSEAVWNHWLSARYGSDVVRDTWAASAAGVRPSHLATAAYTESIRANGGPSFSPEFGTFAAATAEWNSDPSFPDATAYPEMRRKGSVKRKANKLTLDDTSFQLLDVRSGGIDPISLKVKAERRVTSTIALVGREGPADAGVVTTAIKQIRKGGRGTVTLPDPSRFRRITAVIVNSDGRSKGFDVFGLRRYISDGAEYKYALK